MRPPNKKRKISARDGPTRCLPTSYAFDNEKSDERQHSSWENLPANVLREIYQSLADVDRASMARVCKPWREGFRDPSLWRTRTIMFCRRKDEQQMKVGDELKMTSGRNAIKLVKQFPRYLKELNITFLHVPWRTSKEIINEFQKFSKLLDDANLKQIVFVGLKSLKLEEQIRIHFLKALKRLTEKQKFLETLFINNTNFDTESGLEFLKCLATSSGATLSLLSIKGFFLNEIPTYKERQWVTEMQKFTKIRYIHIDYATMSEEVIKSWATGCPLLKIIGLTAEEFLPENHSIPCEAWQNLTTTHPDLTVILRVQHIKSTRDMLPILSPVIPVAKLRWTMGKNGVTSEFELTRLLRRVASYHRTIKELFLEIPGDFPSFDTISVQNILSNCSHILPFTCEEFIHASTGRNVWRLREVNRMPSEDDV